MSAESSSQIPAIGHRAELPDVTAPDGSEIRLLIDGRRQAQGASMVEVTLPPGKVSRPVWHQMVEEIWYILEGQGQVWRASPETSPGSVPPVAVGPGDALVIPPRWRFQFRANAETPLRFLCVTLPPWTGDEEARPAGEGGLGPATV